MLLPYKQGLPEDHYTTQITSLNLRHTKIFIKFLGVPMFFADIHIAHGKRELVRIQTDQSDNIYNEKELLKYYADKRIM